MNTTLCYYLFIIYLFIYLSCIFQQV